jgi:hypothetical protein
MKPYAQIPLRILGIALAVCATGAGMAQAQEPTASRQTEAVATAPQGALQIEALVIEVKGRAQHAPVGTAVADTAAWQPVQPNDHYPGDTLIRTGLSSHVTLQFGTEQPYTVVMVERMTLAHIGSLYKTDEEKVSRVHVNYGAVRGGVSEGGLRSSFVVDSTVATLTKRGTWGFRLFVERGTGRYEISLAETGMVEVLNNITRERQNIVSGQYVTESMRRWVEQASFDRTITLQDRFGMTNNEFQFKALYDGGLSVMDPAATANTYQLARPGLQQAISQELHQIQQLAFLQQLQGIFGQQRPSVIQRPEGNFNSNRVK